MERDVVGGVIGERRPNRGMERPSVFVAKQRPSPRGTARGPPVLGSKGQNMFGTTGGRVLNRVGGGSYAPTVKGETVRLEAMPDGAGQTATGVVGGNLTCTLQKGQGKGTIAGPPQGPKWGGQEGGAKPD